MTEQSKAPELSSTVYSVANLQKITSQYLQDLRRAGVETLPSGTGRSIVQFLDDIQAEDVGLVTANQHLQTTKPPAVILKESNAIYGSSSYPLIKGDGFGTKQDFKTSEREDSFAKTELSRGADGAVYPPALSLSQRQNELELLRSSTSSCVKCVELSRCRNKVVFGVGNSAPRLVFLGEAPGADEDRQGEPFVGAAGQLLTKILTACKLQRSDVYILNTVKCRPPGNRNPTSEELDNCWRFTERQLEILRPEFICCLGLIATKQILKTDQPLGKLRQRFHQYRESQVVVTYHPAYLLRTESAKKHVWEDMKMLMKEMGLDPSY